MHVRNVVLTALLPLAIVTTARAETTPVSAYTLDVAFQPSESHMNGVATVSFVSPIAAGTTTTCYLHGELNVDSILANGQQVEIKQDKVFHPFDYSLIATKVDLGPFGAPTSTIKVYYSGYFHASNARSPSDYMRIDDDGVFLRAYGYSPWFPIFLEGRHDVPSVDFPDVTIRTPEPYISVFAGHKLAETVAQGERVTRWRAEKVKLYAAQCTAQKFATTTSGNVVLYHYTDTASEAAAQAIVTLTQELTTDYAHNYRHTSAADECYIMEMPEYGDISSGNVTGLIYSTWQQFTQNENAQRALAHELVHPFVAVPVSVDDSLWSLAIEGFPSYFHLPILERYLGRDFYDHFLGSMESRYIKKRKSGVDRRGDKLPVEKPLLAIGADEMSEYKDTFVLSDRVLLFFDWLRRKMGDDQFFAFTSDMFNQTSLTTQSFRDLIEKYLPGSRADVHRWLETNDYPDTFHFARQ